MTINQTIQQAQMAGNFFAAVKTDTIQQGDSFAVARLYGGTVPKMRYIRRCGRVFKSRHSDAVWRIGSHLPPSSALRKAHRKIIDGGSFDDMVVWLELMKLAINRADFTTQERDFMIGFYSDIISDRRYELPAL